MQSIQKTIFMSLIMVTLALSACTSVGDHPTATMPVEPTAVGTAQTLPSRSAATQTLLIKETEMKLSTSAFTDGQPIPTRYTCSGENISPTLAIEGVPTGAKSLVLIMDDPDAPSGTWVHWVLYNIPPTVTDLPERLASDAQLSGIGSQGPTSFGRPGYGGSCPPAGKAHRYFFKLYALDLEPTLKAGLDKGSLLKQMEGHILAEAQVMGTYQR